MIVPAGTSESQPTPRSKWARLWSYFVGVTLLGLVSAPAFRDATDDGFPFSTYTMFARPRTKVSLWFTEGVARDGRSVHQRDGSRARILQLPHEHQPRSQRQLRGDRSAGWIGWIA